MPIADKRVSCYDCDTVLDEKGYCETCEFTPSMQDTYITFHCPSCGARIHFEDLVSGALEKCRTCKIDVVFP